jgi:hypothetical protein
MASIKIISLLSASIILSSCGAMSEIRGSKLHALCVDPAEITSFRVEAMSFLMQEATTRNDVKARDYSDASFDAAFRVGAEVSEDKSLAVTLRLFSNDGKVIFDVNNVGNDKRIMVVTASNKDFSRFMEYILKSHRIENYSSFEKGESIPLNFCE